MTYLELHEQERFGGRQGRYFNYIQPQHRHTNVHVPEFFCFTKSTSTNTVRRIIDSTLIEMPAPYPETILAEELLEYIDSIKEVLQ